MERQLATVRKVKELVPIQGADRIELVRFDSIAWSCVAKKGEFKPGDWAVYFEIDSFLPMNDPRYEFLAKSSSAKSELLGKGIRIRSQRFRGALSQGLALPVSEFPEIKTVVEGEDVTALLNVRKWEIPEAASNLGTIIGGLPFGIPETDEVRIQTMPILVDHLWGYPYYISQKLDGTSVTIYRLQRKHGVCSHTKELADDGKSILWDFVNERHIFDVLDHLNLDIVIQGEWCGPKIQKNRLKLKKGNLFVFNVMTPGYELLPLSRAQGVANQLGLDFVPVLEEGDGFCHSLDELLELAKGRYASGMRQEGIVVRPKNYVYDEKLKKGLSFKVLNNEYLLKDED